MTDVVAASGLALGIDIGGTFTDVVLAGPDGIVGVAKRLTTPRDPAVGAVDATRDALDAAGVDPSAVARVVHGTTLATNTILEGRGGPVAFVTTRGFRHLLMLGRHARVEEDRYDPAFDLPDPPVASEHTFEVTERIGPGGEVIVPLDEDEVRALAAHLASKAPEVTGVAVCFLHSYANSTHERRVAETLRAALADRGRPVTVVCSHEVSPEAREYERATTTVMSALVGPVMSAYLDDLRSRLAALGLGCPLYVMESAGGVMSLEQAIRRAVATVESGPAAGVIAAQVIGRETGHADVIAFDMGGTTAKAAVIRDGEPDVSHEFQVGGKGSFGARRSGTGVPIRVPTIDLAEVGAGGGSIAWINAGGTLQVGPRSAGSDPGPACYGRGGTEPTVTDAAVVLGYLDLQRTTRHLPAFDAALASEAITRRIAEPLGVPCEEAAAAIYDIATAVMAGAIHVVTVQRGIDPRRCVLVSSGGAGPLHAAAVAERFGITTVLVPPACGVASAVGLVAADLRVDLVRSVQLSAATLTPATVEEAYAALEAEAATELAATPRQPTDVNRAAGSWWPGSAGGRGGAEAAEGVTFLRGAEVRYRRQAHNLTITPIDRPVTAETLDALADRFFAAHRAAFGVGEPGPVELVNVRVRATRAVASTRYTRSVTTGPTEEGPRPLTRRAWVRGAGFEDVPVLARARCRPGLAIDGPALVEDTESTVLVPAGWAASVHDQGTLMLTAVAAPEGEGGA